MLLAGLAASSGARCRGSRICVSCAAPVATPMTLRPSSSPTPSSCARRTRMPISSRSRRLWRAPLPGVLAVLTGEDYLADGHIGMSHFPNPADAVDVRHPTFAASLEQKILDELQLPLAVGRVRHVGEAVAVVVAETLLAARDAAEAVDVEYQSTACRRPRCSRRSRARRRRSGRMRRAISRSTNQFGDRNAVETQRCAALDRRGRADHPQPAHRQRRSWSRARRSAATTPARSSTR